MEEEWINDLRKKMASHQTPVPPGLWENIESAIHQQQPVPMSLRKRILLWTSGVGGIAAAVTLAFFFFRGIPESEEMYIPQEMAKVYGPTKILSESSEPAKASNYSSEHSEQHVVQKVKRNMQSKPVEVEKTSERAVALADKTEKTEDVQPINTEKPKDQKKSKRARTEPMDLRNAVSSKRKSSLLASAGKNRKSGIALQLFAENIPHTTRHTGGYGEFVAGTVLPNRNTEELPQSMAPLKEIFDLNLGKEIQTRKKHKLPLKFGITARYQFSKTLSLETGLTYTYLGSELSSGTDQHYFFTRQQLQYLGVPLSLSYDVWKNKHLNFYLSAGGSLEKCIYGKSKTSYVLNRKKMADREIHVMEKPLQCSVNGAIGAQINFSSHVGLYIEPGVGYYFDNGSHVETIYKEHPLNLSFKMGMRFSLN